MHHSVPFITHQSFFRLLLKVAVKGTHQCDFLNFCWALGPQHNAGIQVTHQMSMTSKHVRKCYISFWTCATFRFGVTQCCILLGQAIFLVTSITTLSFTNEGRLIEKRILVSPTCSVVGSSSQAGCLQRNAAMDDSIGGS